MHKARMEEVDEFMAAGQGTRWASMEVAAGCGAHNRAGSDFRDRRCQFAHAARDMAVRAPDMVGLVDLEPILPPSDLLDTEPDLARPGCSLVGEWDVGINNLLTLDRRGGLTFEFGPFGTYTVEARKLSVRDDFSADCAMPGQYTLGFNPQCSMVTVRVIADPCVERTVVFEAQDWLRR